MDISKLIKKATTPVKDSDEFLIDSVVLNSIKSACKTNPDAVKEAFYYLSLDMGRRNGVIRMRALSVIDCLFHRSKAFRELVCLDIKTIVGNMGLFPDQTTYCSSSKGNSNNPPSTFASEVAAKGKELVELWDHQYGDRYPQLRAVARYLREVLKLDMPNILENARLHAERSERNRVHSRNVVIVEKDQIIQNDWNFYMNEWRRSLTRLEEIFALLFPRLDTASNQQQETTATAVEEDEAVEWVDEEGEEYAENTLQEENLGHDIHANIGAPYTLTIRLATAARDLETADNAILLQHVREIARHLLRSAVPRMQQWCSVFSRAVAIYGEDVSHLQSTELSHTSDATTTGVETSGEVVVEALVVENRDLAEPSSLLGKRSAQSEGASSASPPPVSVTPESMALRRAMDARDDAHRRLAELEQLLRSIQDVLTGKVKELLQDEAL